MGFIIVTSRGCNELEASPGVVARSVPPFPRLSFSAATRSPRKLMSACTWAYLYLVCSSKPLYSLLLSCLLLFSQATTSIQLRHATAVPHPRSHGLLARPAAAFATSAVTLLLQHAHAAISHAITSTKLQHPVWHLVALITALVIVPSVAEERTSGGLTLAPLFEKVITLESMLMIPRQL